MQKSLKTRETIFGTMTKRKEDSTLQDLNLDDFLRIVDVATTVRQKQEEVHQQLNIDDTKDELKNKLMETAKVTGEKLTDSQIEIAINNYYL